MVLGHGRSTAPCVLVKHTHTHKRRTHTDAHARTNVCTRTHMASHGFHICVTRLYAKSLTPRKRLKWAANRKSRPYQGFVGFVGFVRLVGFVGFARRVGFVGFVGFVQTVQGDGGPLDHTIQHSATYSAGGWGPPPPCNIIQHTVQEDGGHSHHTMQFNGTYNSGGWGPPSS